MAWILLWLPATLLLGLAPAFYWLAGVGENTTASSQTGAAAYPALLAAALVLAVAVLARRARALALIPYGAAALGIARLATFDGDGVWTLYWAAAFAGWLALSVVCLRR